MAVSKPSDEGSSSKEVDSVDECRGESSGLTEEAELKEEAGSEEPMEAENLVCVDENKGREGVVASGWCCGAHTFSIILNLK